MRSMFGRRRIATLGTLAPVPAAARTASTGPSTGNTEVLLC